MDIDEGMAPLSHDSSVERAIRKHMKPRSRRHMQGSDRYRRSSPMKKIKARLKRPSRHQPSPEVKEAFEFITNNMGKPITEGQLKSVSNRSLVRNSIDLLAAMALGGWEKLDEGITNGNYVIEGDNYDVVDGTLRFNNKPLNINWDWIYSTREMCNKLVSEDLAEFEDISLRCPYCGSKSSRNSKCLDCGMNIDSSYESDIK